jgi:hypothetical protein
VGDDMRLVVLNFFSVGPVLHNDFIVLRYFTGIQIIRIDNVHKHPPVPTAGFNLPHSDRLHQDSCMVFTRCISIRNSFDYDIWKYSPLRPTSPG